MAEASLGNLGVANVQIRVDWEKLDDDLNKSKSKISSAFEQSGKLMRNVGAAMTAGLTAPITALIGVSTKAASRVNELQSVNMLLGKSAGYSEDYVLDQAQSVQDMGIEAAASQEIIADFIKAELDLADASKIARVAQDAAVIAGENSTETTKTLTNAIITGRTELFKSAGMIIDLNAAYEDYAEMTGKSAESLTEQEKVQARVNATLAYGERIAGAYATAMEDPGKVLRSYPRYLNDVAVAFGQNFIPAFKEAIFAGKDLLSWLKEAVSEGGALEPVIQKWGERFADAAAFVGNLIEKLDDMDPVMVQTIADVVAMGAAMGPVLLIGGQMMTWAVKAGPAIKGVASAFGMATTSTLGATAALAPYIAAIAAVIAGIIYLNNLASDRNATMVDEMKSTAEAADSYSEYNYKLREAAKAKGLLIDENGNLVNKNRNVIESNYLLSQSEFDKQKALEDSNRKTASTEKWLSGYADQVKNTSTDVDALIESQQAAAAAQEEFNEALSITSNFSSIVSIAKSYDQTLGEIEDKQKRVQQLMEIKDSGGYLDGVWMSAKDARGEIESLNGEIGDLQQSMTDMANQMVLDMYQSTLAIGGFTDEEMQAYFDMAVEMGIISEEAAENAMETYYGAVEFIGNNPVLINADYSQLEEVTAYINGIPTTVTVSVIADYYENQYGNIDLPDPDEDNAAGGLLGAGQMSLVGERGPELFIPKVAGSIIANSELMRALRGSVAAKEETVQREGDVIVHANVANDIDIYRLARKVSDQIRRRR